MRSLDDLFADRDLEREELVTVLFKAEVLEIVKRTRGDALLSVEPRGRQSGEDLMPISDLPAACLALDGPGVVGWVVSKRRGQPATVYAIEDKVFLKNSA